LNWTTKDYGNFAAFAIVTLSGATAIIQPWNYSSASGIPGIADAATLVAKTGQSTLRSVKLQDLVTVIGTVNRFVIVSVSRSGKFSYSNEVVLTQP
jgi:hypothetical protein